MKTIFNKGKRTFEIKDDDNKIIRLPKNKSIKVNDERAKKLIGLYPRELEDFETYSTNDSKDLKKKEVTLNKKAVALKQKEEDLKAREEALIKEENQTPTKEEKGKKNGIFGKKDK